MDQIGNLTIPQIVILLREDTKPTGGGNTVSFTSVQEYNEWRREKFGA